jgi:hypothetical protein
MVKEQNLAIVEKSETKIIHWGIINLYNFSSGVPCIQDH